MEWREVQVEDIFGTVFNVRTLGDDVSAACRFVAEMGIPARPVEGE